MLSQAHLQCLKVGQDRIGSLGQSGTLLPFTAVVGNSCSFMVNTEQVLAWISPVKRLEPKTMPPKKICFNLHHIPLCCQRKHHHYVPHCLAMRPLPLCRNVNTIPMPTRNTTLHLLRKKWCYAEGCGVVACYLLSPLGSASGHASTCYGSSLHACVHACVCVRLVWACGSTKVIGREWNILWVWQGCDLHVFVLNDLFIGCLVL